jgi:hypothetical protein
LKFRPCIKIMQASMFSISINSILNNKTIKKPQHSIFCSIFVGTNGKKYRVDWRKNLELTGLNSTQRIVRNCQLRRIRLLCNSFSCWERFSQCVLQLFKTRWHSLCHSWFLCQDKSL